MSARAARGIAVAILPVLLFTTMSHAASARRYPQLAARSASIGSVTLVADATLLADVFGPVEQVRLQGSVTFATRCLAAFGDDLARRGYPVKRRAVLSLGGALGARGGFSAAPERPPSPRAAAALEVPMVDVPADTVLLHPPFWRHPALADSARLGEAWQALVTALADFPREERWPEALFSDAVPLSAALGGDVLAVLIFISNEPNDPDGLAHRGSRVFEQSLAAEAPQALPYRGFYRLALLDGRTGDLLWTAFSVVPDASLDGVAYRAKEMVEKLPARKR